MLKNVRRGALMVLGLGGVTFLAALGWVGWLYSQDNFHEVIPGTLYRSAQPDGDELRADIRRYGIRSVLNLRGSNPDQAWYRTEISVAKEEGITHADFRMSAREILPEKRVAELEALMKRLPKPILIHCKQGADRTGLASALFLARYAKEGETRAERQLSFRYGHISIPWLSAAWPMNETWEMLEPLLGFRRS